MAVIELVDRDVTAKGQDSGPVFEDSDFDAPTEKVEAPKAGPKPAKKKAAA